MIVVDTPIWVTYFRAGDEQLEAILNAGQALLHPFVLGELVLGYLSARAVKPLLDVPKPTVAGADEVFRFIRANRLSGSGIGYVDAHLLASARLMPASRLWTRDKHLLAAAVRLQIPVESRVH